MIKDYCEYILSLNDENTETSYLIEGKACSKEEFSSELKDAFKLRKQAINVEVGFDPDIFLFEVLKYFFSDKRLFLNHYAQNELWEASKKNWDRLCATKKKWIENDRSFYDGMYEEVFEIVTKFMILMENTRISIQQKGDEKIYFYTSEIEINDLIGYVFEVNKNESTQGKRFSIHSPLDLLKRLKPEKKTIVDLDTALYYFAFILNATYTRNNEIKGGVGNGW